ncbi:MAG: divergent PAP2 family protein [Nanoarchaeota archaeon]|nr:divergent PAP2 family protein [Nanoarchaeota archaeon]
MEWEFIPYRLLLSVLISIALGQTIKFLMYEFHNLKWNFNILRSDGGTPSGHAATVSSLTTALLFETGLSLIFFTAFVFSLIIMRDACGVRLDVQKHAKLLNSLGKSKKYGKFRERVGHTRFQVAAGASIGVAVAIMVYIIGG